MPLELLLELGCPIEKLSGHTMYLALHIELVALDLQYSVLAFASLIQDETLLGHVHFDLFKGDVSVLHIVRRAEL